MNAARKRGYQIVPFDEDSAYGLVLWKIVGNKEFAYKIYFIKPIPMKSNGAELITMLY
jgi:hypothetical protein